MEATQMTQNWMSHHVKQQGLSNAGSSTSGGNESNSQLSGKKLQIYFDGNILHSLLF